MMNEKKRESISTTVYQCEVEKGVVVPGSQCILFGLKQISRIGIIGINGETHSIQYDTLKGHYNNNMLWLDRFLFSADIKHDCATIFTPSNSTFLDPKRGI